MDVTSIKSGLEKITSTSNQMLVLFRSDSAYQYKGFKARWTTIISQAAVDQARKSLICFKHAQYPFQVYDGGTTTALKLAHLCEEDIKNVQPNLVSLTSSGNEMLILFKSDGSVQMRGFKAQWTTFIPQETMDNASKAG